MFTIEGCPKNWGHEYFGSFGVSLALLHMEYPSLSLDGSMHLSSLLLSSEPP